jgi:hypothetical protein
MGRVQQTLLMLVAAASPLLLYGSGTSPVFFPDDPIQVMPPPAPVVRVRVHKIDQAFDFISNSLQWKPGPSVPSGAVNTLGVPPNSAWFNNRHGTHRMTREELQGGATGQAPVPPFTIVGGKTEGITPGFRMEDAKGRLYFVKVDPPDNPEMATAADVITSRFLYAIGYNVPENYIVRMRSSNMRLSDKAQITSVTGRDRKMTADDLQDIVKAIPHYPDGSFRVMASLKVEGEAVGPFYYHGMRSDDPNDLVPHENRRDLRALFLIFAWLNNTDARSGNTYDVIVHEGGVSFIRHHLIDFGSSLGSDGDRAKDPRLGHEFMIATPGEAMRSILTLGFLPHAWERIDYPHIPAIGRFTSAGFDPENWKTDYPNQAFLSRSVEDEFWAAEQVMAFTSDDIRAIVETGQFSDSLAGEYMANTLAERRDIIGRTYFAKVLPIDNFRVENGELRFDDLAVQHEFRPARQYEIRWSRFDNMTGRRTLISSASSSHLPEEAARAALGAYFSAVITLPVDKLKSVIVTIRKTDTGYRVVGCSRSQNGSI